MSGHSKWSTIKHKKAKTDSARGKVYTKIVREITSAAKQAGADPANNPRLRLAIDKAKEANMPNDNVERAITKATGGGDFQIEEVTYEGYGPGGVAIMVECMTDNSQRTVSEIRSFFTKNGGNMGAAGCVGWMFKKKGSLVFDKAGLDSEQLGMAAIEAGAEDIVEEDDSIEILTSPDDFEKVRDALKAKGYKSESAEVSMIPSTTVQLEGAQAEQAVKLVGILEDYDDVQNVYSNFDVPDEIMEKA
ncbi:MAG: YebC/PmpR family DNA-binding transcriptional regulator [bacterium]